ncbi:MAG: exodeoxyribonuclease III [Nitrosospira sp.]|jgi:exodeoxyribonuclease-3|nr:exodeoxyribonuclease III [Nitrosospira sp.]MDW7643104.1 exodeoxyribonuclease III [Nitrosomonadaceae bacterium]MBI0408128.1 exodeoxyribonuclease III [Nitrosospira sp.]MBI0414496.1 exodeoxyribonuclease III [Nitrosospira sp.]MCX7182696.1 exodeoxyribonuclease III [Nitrosospira sp.]
MRIITLNLNGVRSATNKGFLHWFAKQEADIFCVQELKAQTTDLTADMLSPNDYCGYFHCAEKKGYSGVGIYCRKNPDKVIEGMDIVEIDAEGRYLQVDFGHLSIISVYFPSGSSGQHRQTVKDFFLDQFFPILKRLVDSDREIILCGDLNIAHKEIDLRNWRPNQKNSGFLPRERAWLTRIFDELKLVDVFRHINQEQDQYTWWSNRGRSWANNVGWRIDYQVATPGIAHKAKNVFIYKAERFSDHSPLIIDYNYNL